jgi:ABC-type dipeptide/oligopeptide/nickel transport system permease component
MIHPYPPERAEKVVFMPSQRLRYYSLKCLSIVGLLLVTFTLPHLLPGPPLRLYESRFDGPDRRANLIKTYGFDRSLTVQYSLWMKRLASGQWGYSRHYHRPVFSDVAKATGFTLIHLLWTVVSYAIWTVILKVAGRLRTHQPLHASVPNDDHLRWLEAIPGFLVALVLYDVAVWHFGWADLINVSLFAPTYYRKPLVMLIPASALALTPLIIWHVRSRHRRVYWAQPSTQTGKWASYMRRWRLFSQHFCPVLGYFLMELLLIEYIFTLPGLGSVGVTAIRRRDFPLLQGFILAAGGLYMILIMIFDQYSRDSQASDNPNPPTPRKVVRPTLGLLALLALATWAPDLSPHDATEIHTSEQLLLPNARYVLGTDFLGRDVLSRTLLGFRASLPRVLLITLLIAALSSLLSIVTRLFPRGLQRCFHSIPALFEAFPPFLLTFMVFVVVEQQHLSLEIALLIASIPGAFVLFSQNASALQLIGNIASIGKLVLLLDVIFFYLRLIPEPILPTWGGDIRIGSQYSHINAWALLSPTIAVICSHVVLHQLSIYLLPMSRAHALSPTIWRRRKADGGTAVRCQRLP